MVALNDISKSYSVRPLNEGETLYSFNCGDAELNEFILSKASEYKKTLLAVSYVLEENGNPIAYFSLSNDNLSAEIFESKTNFNRQMRKRFSSIAINCFNSQLLLPTALPEMRFETLTVGAVVC